MEVLCIMLISNFYKCIHGKYETSVFIAYITALSIMCVCVGGHAHTLGCIQLFMTPMECRPLGPSVHRIFQARILEWTAIFYSKGSSPPDPGIDSCVFCIGRQILYHCITCEALSIEIGIKNVKCK